MVQVGPAVCAFFVLHVFCCLVLLVAAARAYLHARMPCQHTLVCAASNHGVCEQVERAGPSDIVLRGISGEAHDLTLHKSSVLYQRVTPPARGSLVTFHQKMATSRSFVMDATLVVGKAGLEALGMGGRGQGGRWRVAGGGWRGWVCLAWIARYWVVLEESSAL